MSTQFTALGLLTREGALNIVFTPALTPEQYDQLLREIENDGNTKEELRSLIRWLAASWQCQVTFEL